MLLALLAFSSLPLSHEPRPSGHATQLDRPFFVGEMQHIVRQDQLPWQPSETATPVLDEAETRLYVGTHDGKVRCRFRGKNAWVFQTRGAILASPALVGETLLVPGGDGVLYALNRFTGAPRWQTDIHEELTTSPTISEGRAFLMSSEQSITAVDVKDGKVIWKFHRDPPGPPVGPALDPAVGLEHELVDPRLEQVGEQWAVGAIEPARPAAVRAEADVQGRPGGDPE